MQHTTLRTNKWRNIIATFDSQKRENSNTSVQIGFLCGPPDHMGQDDGMVVTVSLDLMQGGGGFGLALCEQDGAFQESELGGSEI